VKATEVEVEVEVEPLPLDDVAVVFVEAETLRMPPTGPPGGEVLVVAFWARAAKAARVLPVVGLQKVKRVRMQRVMSPSGGGVERTH
jgi:hypothetical protein